MAKQGENNKKEIREKPKYKRGENPNSRKNLIPAQEGEVRNPNGRGEGVKNRSTILKEILSTLSEFKNPIAGKVEKMEVEKAVDLAIVGKALKGDVSAWREIKDSVYGKTADNLNLNATIKTFAELALEAEKEINDRIS
jgi:hypothetical protein